MTGSIRCSDRTVYKLEGTDFPFPFVCPGATGSAFAPECARIRTEFRGIPVEVLRYRAGQGSNEMQRTVHAFAAGRARRNVGRPYVKRKMLRFRTGFRGIPTEVIEALRYRAG